MIWRYGQEVWDKLDAGPAAHVVYEEVHEVDTSPVAPQTHRYAPDSCSVISLFFLVFRQSVYVDCTMEGQQNIRESVLKNKKKSEITEQESGA